MIQALPPSLEAAQARAELPLVPGSDPLILSAYRWTVAHSASLQGVVRQLAAADRKARFRLVPGLGTRYGFLISPTQGEYQIDIEVPILAWSRCGDALEPWIASSLFLAWEVIRKEQYRAGSTPYHYYFIKDSIRASFAFQRLVRKELLAADPVRLKDLPDGALIYESGFQLAPPDRGGPARRALPDGVGTLEGPKLDLPPRPTRIPPP